MPRAARSGTSPPCAASANGPEVVRTVLGHLADHRQARPGLDRELEPVHLLRDAAAAVVARLVRRDQAQLAHPGFQRAWRTRSPVTDAARSTISPIRERVSERGEVGPHPGAEVTGGADVEHALAARRGTGRHRGSAAGVRPGAACGVRQGSTREVKVAAPRACARRGRRGAPSARAARRPWPARPRAPGGSGVVAERNTMASELSLQFGASSRVITRRASRAVSTHLEARARRAPAAAKCLRKPTSNGALWATRTVPCANSQEGRQRRLDRAARRPPSSR